MPLVVLTADEAINRTREPFSRWPRSPEQQAGRLAPLAQPRISPSFRIDKDDLIFTIGSCFARNIEKQLIIEGYRVAAEEFEPPAHIGVRGDPGTLLNRYVIHSIANELRWGLGHGKPFRLQYYLRHGELWYDPHMHPAIRPGAFEAVQERREAIWRYMRRASDASVFVITLGLAEAWFDSKFDLYLNGVIPDALRRREPSRFQFHILDYEQVLSQLNFIYKLVRKFGCAETKLIVTVSPVALNTTFSGGDALIANSYSKAVQRAAVEAFVAAHEGVDYFPSYESVMLSDRERVWREDQAHPSDEIVRLNVLRMIEAYTEGPIPAGSLQKRRHDVALEAYGVAKQAKAAADVGDPVAARAGFRAARQLAPNEVLIALMFGDFLLAESAFEEARVEFKAAVRLGGARYGAYYRLAKALRGLERFEDALEASQAALKYEPTRTGLLSLRADLLGRLGRYQEALEFAERCVALEPETDRFSDLVNRLRLKARPTESRILNRVRKLGQKLPWRQSLRSGAEPAK